MYRKNTEKFGKSQLYKRDCYTVIHFLMALKKTQKKSRSVPCKCLKIVSIAWHFFRSLKYILDGLAYP